MSDKVFNNPHVIVIHGIFLIVGVPLVGTQSIIKSINNHTKIDISQEWKQAQKQWKQPHDAGWGQPQGIAPT